MQTLNPASAGPRILELDGFRGLAILLVLLYHYFGVTLRPDAGVLAECMVGWLSITWAGVDLFLFYPAS